MVLPRVLVIYLLFFLLAVFVIIEIKVLRFGCPLVRGSSHRLGQISLPISGVLAVRMWPLV